MERGLANVRAETESNNLMDSPAPADDSAGAEAVADIIDVDKTYEMGTQKVHALRGVSVQFARGSFWAIMGPVAPGRAPS